MLRPRFCIIVFFLVLYPDSCLQMYRPSGVDGVGGVLFCLTPAKK